jgi:hypothetical protein
MGGRITFFEYREGTPDIGGIDSYTKLLLHGDEDPLVDSSLSSKALTLVGGVSRSATQSKFGGYSISMNGSSQYINLTDDTDFEFLSGDFTIDAWIYRLSSNDFHMIFSKWDTSSLRRSFMFFVTDVNRLEFWASNDGTYDTPLNMQGATTINPDTWYHVAVERIGNVWSLYVNGNIDYDVTGAYPINGGGAIARVGVAASAGNPVYHFDGYIDELRVSKGIGRYNNTNFTPPTSPYTT